VCMLATADQIPLKRNRTLDPLRQNRASATDIQPPASWFNHSIKNFSVIHLGMSKGRACHSIF
jgi:hypothetical protein